MAYLIEATAGKVDVSEALTPDIGAKAQKANLSVRHYVNQQFPQADLKVGQAYDQILASCGLSLDPQSKNIFGLRDATVAEVLEGSFLASNVRDHTSPFGTAARTLFPYAVTDMVENKLKRDYITDGVVFSSMVANEQAIATEMFEQPVIDYGTLGGPEQAQAQRIAQFALPPRVLRFSTSTRIRTLPTYGIMMEFSQQALRATTLDTVALVTARYVEKERDERVYRYLSSLFAGDDDMNTGAVSSVATVALDPACPAKTITHKAWVKFLARNRRVRQITHVIADHDTYLLVEGRSGRPGTNNYDPSLARIDPQMTVMNSGFGNDVKWLIVDPATEGGPVPANTIWAVDARDAITRVSNTSANYAAAESFALRRSESMVMHWSEEVYRTMGNTDLRSFDVLTISQ